MIAALPGSLRRRLAVVENDDGQLTLRFAGGPVADVGRRRDARSPRRSPCAPCSRRYEDAGKTCTQLDVSIPDRTLAKPVLQ